MPKITLTKQEEAQAKVLGFAEFLEQMDPRDYDQEDICQCASGWYERLEGRKPKEDTRWTKGLTGAILTAIRVPMKDIRAIDNDQAGANRKLIRPVWYVMGYKNIVEQAAHDLRLPKYGYTAKAAAKRIRRLLKECPA